MKRYEIIRSERIITTEFDERGREIIVIKYEDKLLERDNNVDN